MPVSFTDTTKKPAATDGAAKPAKPKPKKPQCVETTVHNPKAVIAGVKSGAFEIQPEQIKWGPKIGEGAMALVFKAQVLLDDVPTICVAKKLKKSMNTSSPAYRDLIMELDIMSSIMKHPNIVHFYGASVKDPKNPVILEELVEGPDLEVFLTQRIGKPLPKPTVFKYCLDLLCGLDFMHSRDPIIIHRDLKPANLMLSKDLGTLKIADFGMSKKVDAAERLDATHKGHTGSLRYMAPEVAFKETAQYTEKADIYSAAIIMYFIASEVRPNHVSRDHPDPKARPDPKLIPWPNMAKLIKDLWKRAPESRPSAREGIQRMHEFSDKPLPHERVAPPPPKKEIRSGFD